MKNPYKSFSKVRPDPKRGFRQIATDILYALGMAPLSGSDFKVIHTVINLSWGYRKKSVIISYNQIAVLSNLSRGGVMKATEKLVNSRILLKDLKLVNNSLPLVEWMINKYYDTWLDKSGIQMFTSPQVQLVHKLAITGQQNALQLVNKRGTLCKIKRYKDRGASSLDVENAKKIDKLTGGKLKGMTDVFPEISDPLQNQPLEAEDNAFQEEH